MGKVRLPSVKPPLPSPKSTTRPGGAERNQSTLPSPLKSNSTCERDVLVPRVTLVGVKFSTPGVEWLIHHWLPPSWKVALRSTLPSPLTSNIWWISVVGKLPLVTRVKWPWPSLSAAIALPPPWLSRKRSRSPSLSRSTRCSPLSHQSGLVWYICVMMAPTPLVSVTLVNRPTGGGGLGFAVSVAVPEVVLPTLLLTTQRNWSPLS